MVWGQLAIDQPHLAYIILGGFTSLFMLCSSVIKERFYIGEATVATLCGVIFGPHAANVLQPDTWGNVDRLTLEFSRIVLVVQCFAVGVELPRAYMERHWRSVVFLLVPVMTFGWLITSVFIWGLMPNLNWLDSLVVAACVTATDPVLASSVVGKGKFAKRVPKHLRDLLSAESGCNDGMAFPFVYLSLYLVTLNRDAGPVSWHWIGITILYECIFGAIYGVVVGYIARRAIRYAHERDLIDRESFLVFYFVLALFCAGSGSILGIDDLLVGFACGVGFSNDGWFLEKTEESHVSNVIDLLINLAFFVYFGTIIPWGDYNSSALGTSPWRLVVLALLVLMFRRIPAMMALKPLIPDVKTWREALFAGHFGPMGVGAIFVAILARAELETETTTPAAALPTGEFAHLNIIQLIWPITTFLVMASILVHGSSIAVFTLGKHINTLTITMSYTQAQDEGNWMDRLPRIQSRAKTSASMRRPNMSEESLDDEKLEYPAAALNMPRNFLRRQKEEDNPSRSNSMTRRKRRDGRGGGGHVEESAISPLPRDPDSETRSGSDTLVVGPPNDEDESPRSRGRSRSQRKGEVYEEGDDTIIEDEEGNVLEVMKSQEGESRADRDERVEREVRRVMSNEDVEDDVAQEEQDLQSPVGKHESSQRRHGSAVEGDTSLQPEESKGREGKGGNRMRETLGGLKRAMSTREGPPKAEQTRPHRSGPARAFRFGRTIIVEDEDGEVIKKYEIPAPDRKASTQGGSYANPDRTRERLHRMGTWLGMGREDEPAESGPSRERKKKDDKQNHDHEDDDRIRFTMDGQTIRLNKSDFIKHIESMNPQKRAQVVEQSNANSAVKQEAQADAREHEINKRRATEDGNANDGFPFPEIPPIDEEAETLPPADDQTLNQIPSNTPIPFHSFTQELRGRETAAAQRRRRAEQQPSQRNIAERHGSTQFGLSNARSSTDDRHNETAAERRRREGALGVSAELSDSDEESRHHARPAAARGETAADARRRAAATRAIPENRDSVSSDDVVRNSSDRRGTNTGETAAEKRRREAALGVSREDSDSEGGNSIRPRAVPAGAVPGPGGVQEEAPRMAQSTTTGIRFADPAPRGDLERGGRSGEGGGGARGVARRMLTWGKDKGR